jgi:hypothetical protein
VQWPSSWQKSEILKLLLPVSIADTAYDFSELLDDLLLQAYQSEKTIRLRASDLHPDSLPILSTRDVSCLAAIMMNGRIVRDIVRITNTQSVHSEVENYETHVAPAMATIIPARCRRSHCFWDIGLTVYELTGLNGQALRPLWNEFQRQDDVMPLIALLRTFFSYWRYHYEHRGYSQPPLLSLTEEVSAAIAAIAPAELALPPHFPQLPSNLYALLTTINELIAPEYRTAVTHGSFYSENLLTDGKQLWPINFEKTGPSPIYRDFCDLELDFLMRTLETSNDEQDTYMLMVALLNLHLPEAVLPLLSQPARKLVNFVTALRQLAREVTGVSVDLEYYGTLLLQALHLVYADTSKDTSRRRRIYLYTVLLCQRCHRVETLLPRLLLDSESGQEDPVFPPLTPQSLIATDKRRLATITERHPAWRFKMPNQRKAFLDALNIPDAIINNLAFDGTASDALLLLDALSPQERVINKPTHTPLGVLVEGLLDDIPTKESNLFLVNLIAQYQLIDDSPLPAQYGIVHSTPVNFNWPTLTPQFSWHGPTDRGALERVWSQRAKFHDVVFLERGIGVARATGRVEDSVGNAIGTGFLIGPDLLLTNHHVLPANTDLRYRRVRFGYRIDAKGLLQQGETFTIKELVAHSPDEELDFALVRLTSAPGNNPEIGYLPLIDAELVEESALYIIQHPAGEPQKIVLQDNWTTYVAPDQRRVQYLTNTKGGSSGAAVCNELWQVVALHHSQTPVPPLPAGVTIEGNEGIPMRAILPLIAQYLPADGS